jgi:hypothetical protein
MEAYDLIQYRHARYSHAILASRRRVQSLRSEVVGLLREEFSNRQIRFVEGKWAFRLRGSGKYMLVDFHLS